MTGTTKLKGMTMRNWILSIYLVTILPVSAIAATCDANLIPYLPLLDVNRIQPLKGWFNTRLVGQEFQCSIGLLKAEPNLTYVVEFTDGLPPGITCSQNEVGFHQPELTGRFTAPGIYYAKFLVYEAGSELKNPGVFVFRVLDPNDLPDVELKCGSK